MQRALVVGGTSGIGQGIALALARRSYEVTIAGRSKENGQKVLDQLETPGTFQRVDGFDLSTFNHFRKEQYNVIIMTQGMATLQGYTPTLKDGLDEKLQLHYFSRIHLARLLLPTNPEARILSVLSAGVHSRYEGFEHDFTLENTYSISNAANAAGMYNDAGFEALSVKKHPDAIMVHACPGFVNTNWGTEMPAFVRSMIRPLQSLFATSLEKCGENLTEGLLAIEKPGFHLMNEKGEQISHSKVKHTETERDVIWEKTLEVLPDIVK